MKRSNIDKIKLVINSLYDIQGSDVYTLSSTQKQDLSYFLCQVVDTIKDAKCNIADRWSKSETLYHWNNIIVQHFQHYRIISWLKLCKNWDNKYKNFYIIRIIEDGI